MESAYLRFKKLHERDIIKDLFDNIDAYDGKEVCIVGWAKNLRIGKAVGFIELNDGTHFKNCQIVCSVKDNWNYQEIASQNIGACLYVRGVVVKTPQSKQPFEIVSNLVLILGESTPDYPLQNKKHSYEFLREIAHLRPRTNTFRAVFKIRSEAAFAIHDFFHSQNFVYVHTPILTASDCEGAGEIFQVTTLPLEEKKEVDYKDDFFGKKVGLTVSGQLNGETFAMAFGNIYTFGPTFRAENSNTSRHAAEFWMIEPEMAFCDLQSNMENAEALVKYVVKHILTRCRDELEFLNQVVDNGLIARLEAALDCKFGVVTYTEAIKLLQQSGQTFEYPVSWGCDLKSEHERYLAEIIYKKPVFIIDYPKHLKAFYMRANDDQTTVAAMDLLVPGIGELVGGSQREERLGRLEKTIESIHLSKEDYAFYLDLRRYGGVIHSGYGIGFERLIMYLTGMTNIRDVIPFPRTVGNCNF